MDYLVNLAGLSYFCDLSNVHWSRVSVTIVLVRGVVLHWPLCPIRPIRYGSDHVQLVQFVDYVHLGMTVLSRRALLYGYCAPFGFLYNLSNFLILSDGFFLIVTGLEVSHTHTCSCSEGMDVRFFVSGSKGVQYRMP